MEALWKSAPLTSGEIVERVCRSEDWSPKTVRTLISRLVDKGMINRHSTEGGYSYQPVLDRAAFMQGKSASFVARMFGGRVAPLVAAFAESRSLSDDDLRELRSLVDALEKGDGSVSDRQDKESGDND